MPEETLADRISISLGAQEPWPDNVKLFQPYEVEQILLPDNANCLAVQTFLKMCNLPFEVEMRWNAEFMSPSGRVPFIKCGAFVVSELEPIVQFCAGKGATLTAKLSTEERAEMRAYMSLITNVLLNAELYISWLDSETYNSVTRARNSSVYPWPLGWIQTTSKRSAVSKRLKALNWRDKSLEQVLSDVEQCCKSLSQRLGDKEYFFGQPTQLDALMFGHTRAMLGHSGPRAHMLIKSISSVLLKHALRVSNLTGMRFQPREYYLIKQAFSGVVPKILSQEDNSNLQKLNLQRSETVCCANSKIDKTTERMDQGDSVFGFKPFSAQNVVVMKSEDKIMSESKEGTIMSQSNDEKISEKQSNHKMSEGRSKCDENYAYVDFDGEIEEKIHCENQQMTFENERKDIPNITEKTEKHISSNAANNKTNLWASYEIVDASD